MLKDSVKQQQNSTSINNIIKNMTTGQKGKENECAHVDHNQLDDPLPFRIYS